MPKNGFKMLPKYFWYGKKNLQRNLINGWITKIIMKSLLEEIYGLIISSKIKISGLKVC